MNAPTGSFHRCRGLGRRPANFLGFIPRARAISNWRLLSRQIFFAFLQSASLPAPFRFAKADTSKTRIQGDSFRKLVSLRHRVEQPPAGAVRGDGWHEPSVVPRGGFLTDHAGMISQM